MMGFGWKEFGSPRGGSHIVVWPKALMTLSRGKLTTDSWTSYNTSQVSCLRSLRVFFPYGHSSSSLASSPVAYDPGFVAKQTSFAPASMAICIARKKNQVTTAMFHVARRATIDHPYAHAPTPPP